MTHIFLIIFLFFLSSCGQAQEKRRYQEIVIQSASAHPFRDMMAAQGQDPHAFMKNLPEGEDPHAFMRNMPSAADMKNMPVNDTLMASVTEAALSWKTPEGWQEKPGSGMRVATFIIEAGAQKGECSIISLGAEAGGLEANVKRWAEQIHISLNEEKLAQFVSRQELFKTPNNVSVKLIDFTSLQEKEAAAAPSMMASIFRYPGKTVFVKLTGPKELVVKNRERFKSFCQSLKSNNP